VNDAPTDHTPDAVTAHDLARGLRPGARFRCDGCGNVTRFDVVATTRARRYHHYDLGGSFQVEEEEVLATAVESVTCRWCGRSDAIAVEPAPAGR
jgi:transposase